MFEALNVMNVRNIFAHYVTNLYIFHTNKYIKRLILLYGIATTKLYVVFIGSVTSHDSNLLTHDLRYDVLATTLKIGCSQ